MFSLVERGGEVRSFHVTNVNSKTLRPIMVKNASRKSYLMTDDSVVYPKVGREFAGHGTVNHNAEEYVRGSFWYTNSVESYFALLKRGMMGSFHSVRRSEAPVSLALEVARHALSGRLGNSISGTTHPLTILLLQSPGQIS